MNETKNMQKSLFKSKTSQNNSMNLIIEDSNEKQKYSLEEIRNKVIMGDTFKVLKKIDDEGVYYGN